MQTGACVATLALPGLAATPATANQCAPVRNCASELIEEPLEQAIEAVGGDQIELPNLYANPVGNESSGGSGNCDPSPCDQFGEQSGKYGVYVLTADGKIKYVGQGNYAERRARHRASKPHHQFVPIYDVDDWKIRRGVEQILIETLRPEWNKRNEIAAKPKTVYDALVGAAALFMACHSPRHDWR